MDKINTIIKKEWAEVFKNRMVLFSIIFMPLLFAVIPLVMLGVFNQSSSASELTSEMPTQYMSTCPEGLSGGDCFQIYMVNQFTLLFMMLPLIIPINIAAYSIVGEKTTHSLEPLLATPITTSELLIGKTLAAAIPAILATLSGFLIYAIGTLILVDNPLIIRALLDPMWLLAVLLVGPLLAILSVNFALLVSSRVNDPRVAEQVSAVLIVPLLAVFFGQISGLFLINNRLILLTALVLVAIDIAVVQMGVRLFQRETILTRWK
ncbi:MAG TPA: ABC transporter permease subunit [Anaerolineales bacterium]|nr:ABC transporter permease subunit [Anaerolineales bacterium]